MNRTYSAREALGCWLALGIMGLAFVILSWVGARSPRSVPEPTAIPEPTATRRPTPRPAPTRLYGGCDKIEAYVMAQEFVKQRLRAPASARFAGLFANDVDDLVRDLGGCRYQVTAWVDAQNALGALLRTEFRATLRKVGNDRWQLEALAFD